LKSPFKPTGYWNEEHCYEEAKKYKTRNDFQKGNGSAYAAARSHGWIKDYYWFEEIKKAKRFLDQRKVL
jgi:hypothetical protein